MVKVYDLLVTRVPSGNPVQLLLIADAFNGLILSGVLVTVGKPVASLAASGMDAANDAG